MTVQRIPINGSDSACRLQGLGLRLLNWAECAEAYVAEIANSQEFLKGFEPNGAVGIRRHVV